ncbi:hypothetical protein COD11_18550 [Bacillus sp. AFS040349]|uniref:hypothetical protein n=1 Tax=Metabacillus litoralis TaxID=152268 RepID=UPI000BFDB321|nr:hypothetical protein [Metabacillus litoralis]MCM3412844.1 hypothetical protein [Metabacillus litoralis]PGT81182.1 hypothetical protein COD11_18550 [Bacillus sp. AFS040349]
MYYLDYVSSYFCIAGLLWLLMILGIKFLPNVLKQGKENAAKCQEKLLLISIPLSLIIGYSVFHFFNLYEYMMVV